MGARTVGQHRTRNTPQRPARPRSVRASRDLDWPEPTTLVLGLAGFIVVVCAALAMLLTTGLP